MNKEEKGAKELTVDELKGILHQISEQDRQLFEENKKLREAIEEVDMSNLFKRLDYLFKVVNEDNKFLSEAFKAQCAKEIELLMTQPEVEESPEK